MMTVKTTQLIDVIEKLHSSCECAMFQCESVCMGFVCISNVLIHLCICTCEGCCVGRTDGHIIRYIQHVFSKFFFFLRLLRASHIIL